MPTPSPHHRPAELRDRALARPRRAARWIAGVATVSAAAIAGIVAHQLPGAASATAPGSAPSSTPSGAAGTSGTSSQSGASGAVTPATTPAVAPSYGQPTVVSGGSTVR